MIKAKKNKWLMWGFTRFNRQFIRRNFQNIYIRRESERPLNMRKMFIVNHSSWWDSLIIFFLNEQVIKSDAYGMMHKEGMERFPFFRGIGVYSMDANDSSHLIESLQYSCELLNNDKTVWIFPQGKEQHLEKRPLEFSSGISYIVQKTDAVDVVPVSLYYSFGHTKKPDVYIQVGRPLENGTFQQLSRKKITDHLETVATEQLDLLKSAAVKEQHDEFVNYGRS
ncbi:lysophospholipid acyltransferase family protein [Halobacillus sp. Marseille-Q1614]|uniref:lysophospholipid acyltransferase family protein n=1 Tax=Halobacillus sp. Marseille-Q1614 TaxID=2709134 RepID=UPI00156ECF14|nr:lysophospholipid acyltransferase family protein [Halobacillus sp. Marseille-Q1614]